MERHAGTLIIGGGIAGSALAMHLGLLGERGVVVVDPDLAGARSSSELNAGGVRATWWRAVNVELCAATIDYFAARAPELGLRQRGYLWLYGPELWQGARAHVALQNQLGREVELLAPSEVARRWPFIDSLDGIAGATFSPKDGLVNPNAVKEHYRAIARERGVEFLDRKLVVEIGREGDRVTSARVRRLPDEGSAYESLEGREATGPEAMIAVERMVNAAGPWAGQVARLLGAPVHTRAVPRQISVSACRDVDLSGEGMIVDTTGVYLHHESGDLILTGYSPPGDPPGYRFRYEGAAFFEREIWPRLAARISAMDRLQHVRGWAGLYELSPDNSALLGRVEGLENAFEIHSFSGRGVMQSHAAALSLAELMTTGAMRTHPSAEQLSADRFARAEPQFEDLHI